MKPVQTGAAATEHSPAARIGILLINLGSPDAPTPQALRTYLKQFLSSPRIIETPKWMWWPILYGIVLNFRPKKSAQKYAKIWTTQGSPLKVYTERQSNLLRNKLKQHAHNTCIVEYAMIVGKPAVADIIQKMSYKNCDRILVIPLFPQYAASSTAAVMDSVFSAFSKLRNMPAIRTIKQYHDNPGYIAALAQNIQEYWQHHGRPDKLIMSFHGTPRKAMEKGDPYQYLCQHTGKLLADALSLKTEQYQVCFQSRFGLGKWLTPYTSNILKQLGREKLSRVDIVCPGFVSDCLETLEEINIEAKNIFIQNGGSEFHYIPCLNDRDDWIQVLYDITLCNLQGWLKSA